MTQSALSQLVFRSEQLNAEPAGDGELPPYFSNALFQEATDLQRLPAPASASAPAPTGLSAQRETSDTFSTRSNPFAESDAPAQQVTSRRGFSSASELDRQWLISEQRFAEHRFHRSTTSTALHWARIALALLLLALALSSMWPVSPAS